MISIYTTSDYPFDGAAENYVRLLSLGLKNNGDSVEVVRWRGGTLHKEQFEVPYRNYLFRGRPNYEILKFVELVCLIFYIPISVLHSKIVRNTSVIILYGFDYCYINSIFILICKLLKIRCVRIITDYYPKESIANKWWKFPKWLAYLLQFRYIDKYFDLIVVISNYLKSIELSNNVSSNKILLIPHFIDCDQKENASLSKPNDIIIGFCGAAKVSNGILDLVQAFSMLAKKHSTIKLLIIGKISDSIYKSISLILGSNLFRMTITGYLPSDQVKDKLNSCSILVNPRRKSVLTEAGFPTKLGEYLSAKKPVVSTSVGDISFYFTNKEQLILVEPDSTDSLAAGIECLINDEELAIKIANSGYEWAQEHLDYRHNAKVLSCALSSIYR